MRSIMKMWPSANPIEFPTPMECMEYAQREYPGELIAWGIESPGVLWIRKGDEAFEVCRIAGYEIPEHVRNREWRPN